MYDSSYNKQDMHLDSSKTVFVFPGQGSQEVGMGKALAETDSAARDIFAQADEVLGVRLSRLMWEGPEAELNDTINTQPALFAHSVAALRFFQAKYPNFNPAFVAGHSLGELSALVAANSLPFAETLRLVRRRGELMKEAGEHSPGGMAAFLGLDIPAVEEICSKASQGDELVQVANDNCPGQVVVSGAKAAVERAIALATEAGARRAVALAISIAAHSALMTQAQEGFNKAVADAPITNPAVPIIGNVNAAPLKTLSDIRTDLQAQLTQRVHWTESIQYASAHGATTFVEIGTGDVLSGLIKRISREATRLTLGTPEDFEKLAAT